MECGHQTYTVLRHTLNSIKEDRPTGKLPFWRLKNIEERVLLKLSTKPA
jgi:hypothetical protein